jgi:hypothetical protein
MRWTRTLLSLSFLVINEDIHVELLELLELYCELLLARFGLLDQKLVLQILNFDMNIDNC